MEKKMNNKGFSLVELIVVIAIMAVLVGVLAPQFIKYVEKSRESTDIQNADSVRTVVESYYADKDGTKLPAVVEVAITTTGTTLTEKDSPTATGTPDTKALSEGGVTGNKLKSKKWTKQSVTGIKLTFTTGTSSWQYAGGADYYEASGDTFVVE